MGYIGGGVRRGVRGRVTLVTLLSETFTRYPSSPFWLGRRRDRLSEQFTLHNNSPFPALWVELQDESNVPNYQVGVVRSITAAQPKPGSNLPFARDGVSTILAPGRSEPVIPLAYFWSKFIIPNKPKSSFIPL